MLPVFILFASVPFLIGHLVLPSTQNAIAQRELQKYMEISGYSCMNRDAMVDLGLTEGQIDAAEKETFIRKLPDGCDDCNTMVFDPPIGFLPPWTIHKFTTTPVPKLTPHKNCSLSSMKECTIDERIERLKKDQRKRISWDDVPGVPFSLEVHEKGNLSEPSPGNCFEPYPGGNLKPLCTNESEQNLSTYLIKLPELDTDELLAYYGFARLRDGEFFVNNDRHLALRAIYIGATWRDNIIGGWFLEQHPSMHFWAPSPTCCASDSWIFAAVEKPLSSPGFVSGKVFKYAKIRLEPGSMVVSGPNAYHASGFREGVYFFAISGESLEDENKEVDGVQPLTVCGNPPQFHLSD